MPSWKAVALAAVVVVLAGVAGYALLRELAKQPAAPQSSAAAAFTGGLAMHQAQGALTPEEEAFAASLWPIHSEVKLGAVRMIFAGIKYKTGEHDASTLKASVETAICARSSCTCRRRRRWSRLPRMVATSIWSRRSGKAKSRRSNCSSFPIRSGRGNTSRTDRIQAHY
jgi:hypothetical protein